MSKISDQIVGAEVLFTNDTYLFYIDMKTTVATIQVDLEIQKLMHNLGQLLITAEGALQPENSTQVKADSVQENNNYSLYEGYCMSVPTTDDTLLNKRHLPVSQAQKILVI